MKHIAKRSLSALAVRMPFGVSYALWDALNQKHINRDLLIRLASQANISAFLVDGEWGAVQSAIGDKVILPFYGRHGTWARRTNQELISFFAGRSGTYIDIGANIGLTTIPVARNPGVRCHCFEPDPTNYMNLLRNLERNVASSAVSTHQLALFDSERVVRFGLSKNGNLGDHRIVSGANAERDCISVKAMRLDDLDLDIAQPLAVKIDVQGVEPNVIRGARNVLSQAEFVILEFSPYHMAQFGSDHQAAIAFLEGFSRVAIVPGESEEPLDYRPASTACAALASFYKAALQDERKFLDVYACR